MTKPYTRQPPKKDLQADLSTAAPPKWTPLMNDRQTGGSNQELAQDEQREE